MSQADVYKKFIEFHAFRWLKDRQDLNIIEYLETCSGALMSYFITELGPKKVAEDIVHEIDNIA